MAPGDAMILSATRPDAFGPLCKALSISQVTTGYDPTFISAGAFGVHEWEGANPCFFEIAMSETPRQLNLVPRVPLRSDGPELTR
jgi:hypothetical protein